MKRTNRKIDKFIIWSGCTLFIYLLISVTLVQFNPSQWVLFKDTEATGLYFARFITCTGYIVGSCIIWFNKYIHF